MKHFSPDSLSLYQAQMSPDKNVRATQTKIKFLQPVSLGNALGSVYLSGRRPYHLFGKPVVCPSRRTLIEAFQAMAQKNASIADVSNKAQAFMRQTDCATAFRWGYQKVASIKGDKFYGPQVLCEGVLLIGEVTTFGRVCKRNRHDPRAISQLEDNMMAVLNRSKLPIACIRREDVFNLPVVRDICGNIHLLEHGDAVVSPLTAHVKYLFDKYVLFTPQSHNGKVVMKNEGLCRGAEQVLPHHVFLVGPNQKPDRCAGMPEYFHGHWPTSLESR